ncbi:MAG: NAD(P)H-dependent glycerol-3-phosphate dehydrogenase [Bacillota bacterium]
MNKKAAVIGGGSWGTALANILAHNGNDVQIYCRDKNQVEIINHHHINKKYFPNKKLKNSLQATNDLESAVMFADIIVMSVPTQVTRNVMKDVANYVNGDEIFISTAKGIEEKTFMVNSNIIKSFGLDKVVVLSGPTHAEEVINELPTAIVAASPEQKLAEFVQDLFMAPSFRVYTNPDLIGVELGGAVKNIIAVASGICDGLDFGDNTRAALITRGLMEMSRLGISQGGRPMTFAGLAGMGDLVVTCTSMHSRNRRFGIQIGKGSSIEEAQKEVKQVVEGVKTTAAIKSWKKNNVLDFEMPITDEVYNVLFNNKDPYLAVEELMLRGPKHEMEEVVTNHFWDI